MVGNWSTLSYDRSSSWAKILRNMHINNPRFYINYEVTDQELVHDCKRGESILWTDGPVEKTPEKTPEMHVPIEVDVEIDTDKLVALVASFFQNRAILRVMTALADLPFHTSVEDGLDIKGISHEGCCLLALTRIDAKNSIMSFCFDVLHCAASIYQEGRSALTVTHIADTLPD